MAKAMPTRKRARIQAVSLAEDEGKAYAGALMPVGVPASMLVLRMAKEAMKKQKV